MRSPSAGRLHRASRKSGHGRAPELEVQGLGGRKGLPTNELIKDDDLSC